MGCPQSIASPSYDREQFSKDLLHLDIKEDEFPRETLISIHLLMKGNYHKPLLDLLKEQNVPKKIKLLICQFFIEEDCMIDDTIFKTLKENIVFDLKEQEPTIL